MNVLLIGSGGREHALAWKINQSRKLTKLYIAPGNAGTLAFGENTALNVINHHDVKEFVIAKQINMVIIGPEQPLVDGLVDFFISDEILKNIPVIGPIKAGALLEGSKDFAKSFMQKYDIPTARYKSFNKDKIKEGKGFLASLKPPYVLKADGLAAGKGVIILNDLSEAEITLESMLHGKFGKASDVVVVEEFLKGIEVSVFVITDGKSYKILPEAKDYKRIGEGDTGPNTGGMGAISPVPFANMDFMNKVEERIIKPTVNGLKSEGIDYKGFIFIGLMNVNGEPYVIEYNVRMGDPETEVVIPRIKSDILELFEYTAKQKLDEFSLEIDSRFCTTIMLVSAGYPGDYEKGKKISNQDRIEDSLIFHAGTTIEGNEIITSGGRVIAVSSFGDTMQQALEKSYRNAGIIHFDGKYYRKDIGFDLK